MKIGYVYIIKRHFHNAHDRHNASSWRFCRCDIALDSLQCFSNGSMHTASVFCFKFMYSIIFSLYPPLIVLYFEITMSKSEMEELYDYNLLNKVVQEIEQAWAKLCHKLVSIIYHKNSQRNKLSYENCQHV